MPYKDPEVRKQYLKDYYLKRKCEHNKYQPNCVQCKGNGICEHNKVKAKCKECDSSVYCEHNREKYNCKECGGNGICAHNDYKFSCKICVGNGICEHNKVKSRCVECDGGSICPHKKVRSHCRECGGSLFCIHNIEKGNCRECGGQNFCEHNRNKRTCKDCNFQTYLVHLQRGRIRRIMKQTTIAKSMASIEYLDCSMLFFEEFIKRKMTPDMTFDNIHYDHIKPVAKFNLEDPEELMKCCHYSNFQPLLANDNLVKSDNWSDEDDVFWNENIIYKDYTGIYMPK
jgi:hypothetical protein